MKRILALILALAMMLGLTACGGGGRGESTYGSGDVELGFTLTDHGYGTTWLRNAVIRFCEEYADYDFGNGNIGVTCKINTNGEGVESMPTSGTDIYFIFDNSTGAVQSVTQTSNTLDLNDVITAKLYEDGTKSIEDKLYPEDKDRYKGADGHYRALPTHETYDGLSYDRTLFETNGYLIAKPDADGTNVHSFSAIRDILPYVNFVDVEEPGWEENLSVGPDGVEGTSDDGLPSSLMEFFTLCDYMENDGIVPLVTAGGNLTWYLDLAIEGMMESLLGAEKLEGFYDLNANIDVVTNFLVNGTEHTGENPFYGLNYIQGPNYANVTLTEEVGYYTTWSAAKYWAFAWAEVMKREGWIGDGAHPEVSPDDHLATQEAFINGGYNGFQGPADEVAMLSEGTYWYNEANERGTLSNFKALNPEAGEQDLRPMPLPTNIFTTVTGEERTETHAGLTESTKGRRSAMSINGTVFMCANARVAEEDELLSATLKFFEFFHSDEELQRATSTAGFKKMFQYEMDNAETAQGWAPYYKSLFKYVTEEAFVLRKQPSNQSGVALRSYITSNIYQVDNMYYGTYLYKSQANAAYKYHEERMLSAEVWKSNYYKGSNPGAVQDISGVHYISRGV